MHLLLFFVCVSSFTMNIIKPSCQIHFLFSMHSMLIINCKFSGEWLHNEVVNIVLEI